MNSAKEKFERFITDSQEEFSGWDFSYLSDSGRMQEFPLTWNYYNQIRDYCQQANSLLDMGTGGGEFLSSLSFLPEDTCATEGYEPNIKLAKEQLEPLGIEVYPVEKDKELPFKEARFEVIINRHESYSVREIARILTEGGYFITQQVGGLNDRELNLLLGADEHQFVDWDLNQARQELINYDFELIKLKEDEVKTRFYDIGAIIYYLQAVPWQIPNFKVENYREQLFSLHRFIEKQGYFDVTCHRFFIAAKKK